ncbi:MAG: ribokinase [Gammaproteobacteria bacterium]|nr:ribokinase [Gammaproteobacteria bacterium]
MPKLVNLGSLCIDHVYQVPNLAGNGETVASTGHAVFPGGKGLNQSLAAAFAQAAVHHVGCIGEDGAMLSAVLEAAGVDVSDVVRRGGDSGHAVIQVNGSGENAIVIAGGANRHIEDADIERAFAALATGDWLLIQNEINDVERVLHQAAEKGVDLAFNVAPVDGRESRYDLRGVRLLLVNEIEAAALAGESDPQRALDRLSDLLPETAIVLTLGCQGLLYRSSAGMGMLGAYSVDVVDETAAGDAFIGYLMAELLTGRTLEAGVACASAAGALAVTVPGAADSIPRRRAVDEFIGNNGPLYTVRPLYGKAFIR